MNTTERVTYCTNDRDGKECCTDVQSEAMAWELNDQVEAGAFDFTCPYGEFTSFWPSTQYGTQMRRIMELAGEVQDSLLA